MLHPRLALASLGFAEQAWPEPVLRAPAWQAFAPQVWPEPVPPVLQETQHPVLQPRAFPAWPVVAPFARANQEPLLRSKAPFRELLLNA